MRLIALPLVVSATTCIATCGFAACTDDARRKPADMSRKGCSSPKTFEPYDPDRRAPNSRRGFIDVGGGTEVRIGGRTRFEYQYTR